jgi:hypothetical protein
VDECPADVADVRCRRSTPRHARSRRMRRSFVPMAPWRIAACDVSLVATFSLIGWQVQRLNDDQPWSNALMWASLAAGVVSALCRARVDVDHDRECSTPGRAGGPREPSLIRARRCAPGSRRSCSSPRDGVVAVAGRTRRIERRSDGVGRSARRRVGRPVARDPDDVSADEPSRRRRAPGRRTLRAGRAVDVGSRDDGAGRCRLDRRTALRGHRRRVGDDRHRRHGCQLGGGRRPPPTRRDGCRCGWLPWSRSDRASSRCCSPGEPRRRSRMRSPLPPPVVALGRLPTCA